MLTKAFMGGNTPTNVAVVQTREGKTEEIGPENRIPQSLILFITKMVSITDVQKSG